MIYGGNRPWQAEAQEYVDRVAACDVSYGVVCSLFAHSGRFAGKGVGKRGAKSDKSNCCKGKTRRAKKSGTTSPSSTLRFIEAQVMTN